MAIDRNELARLIPELRRYARGLARDIAAADDLVQDCLLLALDRERQFRGDRLKPWVFAILSNVGRTAHRTQVRRPITADDADRPGADADPGTRVAVTAALSALPEEQRQPLLLTAVEGFTYQETADILQVPIGTVMSRISRARDALAERLDGALVVPMRRTK